jgi:hypothetical protein
MGKRVLLGARVERGERTAAGAAAARERTPGPLAKGLVGQRRVDGREQRPRGGADQKRHVSRGGEGREQRGVALVAAARGGDAVGERDDGVVQCRGRA